MPLKFDLKLSDLINLPTTFLTALLIASGVVLFAPEDLLSQMYMLDFRKKSGFIIGIVFICCLSLLIVNLIYQASQSIKKNRNKRMFYANAEPRLRKLNTYQKALVYLLFTQDNRTHPLPLHDGAVLELQSSMIIGRATNQYFVHDINNAVFPYLLQPWVSEELSAKRDLLSEFENAFNIQNHKFMNRREWEW